MQKQLIYKAEVASIHPNTEQNASNLFQPELDGSCSLTELTHVSFKRNEKDLLVGTA